MAIRLQFLIAMQALPIRFGRWYPREGWHVDRRWYVREALVAVVQAHLGMRRTSFRPRKAGAVDLDPKVHESERIQGNTTGKYAIYRVMYTVLAEMTFVLIVGIVAMLWVSWILGVSLIR